MASTYDTLIEFFENQIKRYKQSIICRLEATIKAISQILSGKQFANQLLFADEVVAHGDAEEKLKRCQTKIASLSELFGTVSQFSLSTICSIINDCQQLRHICESHFEYHTVHSQIDDLYNLLEKMTDKTAVQKRMLMMPVLISLLENVYKKDAKIVFFGSSGCGKSCLLNRLVKQSILPEECDHAVVSVDGAISSQDSAYFTVNTKGDRAFSLDDLNDWLDETEDPSTQIHLHVPQWKSAWTLVESRGYGGVPEERDMQTNIDFHKEDVIVYVIDAVRGMAQVEEKFLQYVNDNCPKPLILIVWTHWDRIEPEKMHKLCWEYLQYGKDVLEKYSLDCADMSPQYFISKPSGNDCEAIMDGFAGFNDFKASINAISRWKATDIRLKRLKLTMDNVERVLIECEEPLRIISLWEKCGYNICVDEIERLQNLWSRFQEQLKKPINDCADKVLELMAKKDEVRQQKDENVVEALRSFHETILQIPEYKELEDFFPNDYVNEETAANLPKKEDVPSSNEGGWNFAGRWAQVAAMGAGALAFQEMKILPGPLKWGAVGATAAVGSIPAAVVGIKWVVDKFKEGDKTKNKKEQIKKQLESDWEKGKLNIDFPSREEEKAKRMLAIEELAERITELENLLK